MCMCRCVGNFPRLAAEKRIKSITINEKELSLKEQEELRRSVAPRQRTKLIVLCKGPKQCLIYIILNLLVFLPFHSSHDIGCVKAYARFTEKKNIILLLI